MPASLASVLLVLTATASASAKAPAPALLEKIARNEAQLEHLYDTANYTVTTHYQNLDPSTGALKNENEIVTRMFVKDGRPWEEITKFIEAGKDVTASHAAQREKEVREGKRHREDGLPFKSPFGGEEQPKYRFTELPPDPAAPGRTVIVFEPKTRTKDTTIGKAFVDPVTGTVRNLEFHPAVNANFVHRMNVTFEFTDTPMGAALSRATVDADGGLFFVKRKVHVETKIEGYEIPPAATADAPTAVGSPRPTE